ncbi:MAG: class I SAM-dependent methyltransferase [Planctomycetota bacterium]
MSQEEMDWEERYVVQETPWDSGEPSKELQRILAERSIPPSRVLELGCGTGTNAVFLAKMGFDVTAVDLSATAIEQARRRAEKGGVQVGFLVGNLLELPDLGEPFPFVFDRGVFHVLRRVNLEGFRETLRINSRPGSLYLTLAGNANEQDREEKGPPRVSAAEMVTDLEPLFQVVQLREFQFHGVVIDGRRVSPLAWSGLFRRV